MNERFLSQIICSLIPSFLFCIFKHQIQTSSEWCHSNIPLVSWAVPGLWHPARPPVQHAWLWACDRSHATPHTPHSPARSITGLTWRPATHTRLIQRSTAAYELHRYTRTQGQPVRYTVDDTALTMYLPCFTYGVWTGRRERQVGDHKRQTAGRYSGQMAGALCDETRLRTAYTNISWLHFISPVHPLGHPHPAAPTPLHVGQRGRGQNPHSSNPLPTTHTLPTHTHTPPTHTPVVQCANRVLWYLLTATFNDLFFILHRTLMSTINHMLRYTLKSYRKHAHPKYPLNTPPEPVISPHPMLFNSHTSYGLQFCEHKIVSRNYGDQIFW